MYKWIVLIVVIVVAGGFGWMMNETARELKETAAALREAAADVREASKSTQEVSKEMLPVTKSMNEMAQSMKQGRAGMQAMAQLAQSLNPMRTLTDGKNRQATSPSETNSPTTSQPSPASSATGLSAYADAVLESIGNSGGRISSPIPFSPALPADDWVTIVRPQAMFIVAGSGNDGDETNFVDLLSGVYTIQFGDEEPMPLKDWILENQPSEKQSK